MKYLKYILIISLIVAVILISRSDYKSLYNKSFTFIVGQANKSRDAYNENVAGVMNTLNNNMKSINNSNKSTTPGALVVSEDYLTSDLKSIKLVGKNIIDITNKYRAENGNLPPLKENSKLDFSAEKKVQDMFVKQYFEHVSPSGVGVGDLGNEVAYDYIVIGENLALGNFKDDKSLVDAWMASPGHRANILNKRYQEIGVSVSKGVYNGKSVWMAVQHFALPKSACPTIDEVLHGIIDLDQQNINKMQMEINIRKSMVSSGVVYEGLTTNDQVTKYNSLISDYNKIVADIKEKINTYNEEVRSFNTCIAQVN